MYQQQLREILEKHGRLSAPVAELNDDSNLYDAGLSSLTTVNLMLAIEDSFDVEFPDSALSRATFQSINTLAEVLQGLLQ